MPLKVWPRYAVLFEPALRLIVLSDEIDTPPIPWSVVALPSWVSTNATPLVELQVGQLTVLTLLM